MSTIAVNFTVQARRAGGGVNEITAVVEIAVRARAAGLKVADPPRLGRLAHVENEKSLRERLTFGAAPAGRDSFQTGDHLAVGDLDLDRPGIFRSRNKGDKFRRFRIGDVEQLQPRCHRCAT